MHVHAATCALVCTHATPASRARVTHSFQSSSSARFLQKGPHWCCSLQGSSRSSCALEGAFRSARVSTGTPPGTAVRDIPIAPPSAEGRRSSVSPAHSIVTCARARKEGPAQLPGDRPGCRAGSRRGEARTTARPTARPAPMPAPMRNQRRPWLRSADGAAWASMCRDGSIAAEMEPCHGPEACRAIR